MKILSTVQFVQLPSETACGAELKPGSRPLICRSRMVYARVGVAVAARVGHAAHDFCTGRSPWLSSRIVLSHPSPMSDAPGPSSTGTSCVVGA